MEEIFDFSDDLEPNILFNLAYQNLNQQKTAKRIHDRHIPYGEHEESATAIFYKTILADINERSLLEFRKIFSIPLPIVQNIIQYVETSNWFNSIGKSDAAGNKSIPAYLLVLETIRILTKGCPISTCVIESRISESKLQSFFHKFCENFSKDNYSNYINYPDSREDIERVIGVYKLLGFPGCVGSTDCVHIGWNRVPYSHRHDYIGVSGKGSLSYEFTVDHHKKIMSITRYIKKIKYY